MLKSLVVAVLLAACSKSESPPAATQAPAKTSSKDPQAARTLIAKGAVVLDVRTPEEFASGHLPTATNIPVQDVPARITDIDKLTGGDKAKPIVTYCASGARSAKAKEALEAAGYTNVVNGGGYDDLE